MAKLTAEQREEQFKIVESKEFLKWVKTDQGSALTDDLDFNFAERIPQEYDSWSYKMVEADPSKYDQIRATAIERFEIGKRLGKPLTIMVSTNLQRATRAGVEQITGQDPRLAQFWADAEALAKAQDYCHEYANMVKYLGGPKAKCD